MPGVAPGTCTECSCAASLGAGDGRIPRDQLAECVFIPFLPATQDELKPSCSLREIIFMVCVFSCLNKPCFLKGDLQKVREWACCPSFFFYGI